MSEEIKGSFFLLAIYILYIFGIGVGIAGVCVYGGMNRWPFLDTVLVGGTAQFFYRLGKQRFRIYLGMEASPQSDAEEKLLDLREIDVLLTGYAIAAFFCSFWYGIGRAYLFLAE